MADVVRIADREFQSRLFVGTGKYRSFHEMARCHAASGAEVVTVAVRRVNLTDKSKESLIDFIDRSKIFILPNTAACYTADDAVRTRHIAAALHFAGDGDAFHRGVLRGGLVTPAGVVLLHLACANLWITSL